MATGPDGKYYQQESKVSQCGLEMEVEKHRYLYKLLDLNGFRERFPKKLGGQVRRGCDKIIQNTA